MPSLKNITVSLDYDYPPGLEISACFTARWDIDDGSLEGCVNDVLEYTTDYNVLYLFPIFRKVAEKNKIKFSVRYNSIFGIRRYIYALCLWLAERLFKTQGIDEYKKNMKVHYDGF